MSENIVISSDRSVTVPESLQKIGVQFDHNAETVTFDCPRYWDKHDLSTMSIYVNYMRPDESVGAHLCNNVVIDSVDKNIIHFDWTISGHVTEYAGPLSFLVCVRDVDQNGDITTHWNTELNTEMYISSGMKCRESVLKRYPDIITQLLHKMDRSEVILDEANESKIAAEKAALKAQTAAYNAATNTSLELRLEMQQYIDQASETAANDAAANTTEAIRSEMQGYSDAAEESAQKAQEFADNLNIDAVYSRIELKGDSLYFDSATSLLYLTSGGEIIGDGVTVATSGGSDGSGSSSNNAVLTLQNTTGWIYKTISEGADCALSFTWSSLEEGLETGPGVLKITVGGATKYTTQIDQGSHTIPISEYLSAGGNTIRVTVTDVYGNSRPLSFSVTVVALSLTSSFDGSVAYTGEITYPYVPTATVTKTVYFKMDGNEIGTAVVTASGRQQTFTIPAQSHGVHAFEVYFTAEIDGVTVPSNHLYYDLICYEAGNTTPIIATSFRRNTVEQFENVNIPYIVYDPSNLTTEVILSTSESSTPTELTVDRTEQVWAYRPENAGELTLSITCGTFIKQIVLTVTEVTIDVAAETSGLGLYLTSYGRSNNEADPSVWSYGNVTAELTNFNFVSDGWVLDDEGATVLRVGGDARVNIPVQLFAQDFRTTGKTIEIEFASRSVLDYDAVLATCWSGDRGLQITAQMAEFKSEQSEVSTRYKEDDHLRLSFVIEKSSEHRLILSYINGIVSGMMQYPDDDDFSQRVPVNITIGSNDCTIDIYNIRIYDNDLDRFQVLDNWIADTRIMRDKKDRYSRNDIFDDNGQILPDTLSSHQCYLIIDCPILPTYKDDVKICSGTYVDPINTDRSFTFENAEIDVQGTSSQFYYVKNFKIKFKGGFVQKGKTVETYAMNPNAVPTSEFTFKADVASSEGANNVVLAELYNDLCPVKTPAQEADPRVRQCIEGHPIVVFHDDGNGPYFIGKYNFNNDKGTAEVFGFVSGDESWEIKENGNAQVSFKTDDFTGWETSFEGRYPKKNKDITRLQQFVAWVASTDTTVADLTDEEKTARIAKFKDELADWADVEDAIFYYLFTLIFLCIDQREKNAFPTYNAEMGKWLWLFYDADSSIGTDNKGNLTFEYWMEDIDYTDAGEPVFNGQNNVFWTNLRTCFADEIRDEYRRLRTEIGADRQVLLSYDKVNGLFEAHQSQWSEAIYNEDAWRKAVEPLKNIGDDQYLPMQQGKKEHHFKHWMYNRFRYLDSKFETGAALNEENRIMMRAHAQGDIELTSYINMYGQVYYNSDRVEHRMVRDTAQEFEWGAVGAEDAVIGVNSAPMITSLGDLSPLMLEYCHIQYAKHLTELKVGAEAPYTNGNFVALTLGNNTLLRKLDVRNCTALAQAVDASGCTNIEEIYFDGTAIKGLSLPNGGILKKLHLPGTMTNLTICNQPKLSEFVMPSFENVTTLRLENVPSIVDGWTILHQMPSNSRVRMIGFDWTQDSPEAVLALYDYLDTMRGMDEKGINTEKPQMQGIIRIDSLTGSQLAEMQSRYPSIQIAYQHITSNLYFYNDDGSTLLYTAACVDGANGVYGGATPTKASTAQYTYTFSGGWSLTPGGAANSNALKNVTVDRNVYAVFTATVLTYTVTWMNGSTLLETDNNVPYGTMPTYNGADPVYAGEEADDYTWNGWSPAVGPITGNTTYTAVFIYSGYIYPKLIERTLSGSYENSTVTAVGDYAFANCTSLTSVNFPECTNIGGYAFMSCHSLTSVTFPVCTSIGSNAFQNCSSLTSVSFPKCTNISNYAFCNCYSLTSVSFPKCTYIGDSAFFSCSRLTSVNFPACTSIGFVAFRNCSSLTSISLPACTNIGSTAFATCSSLTSVYLGASTVCTLGNSGVFNGTPIASGTGNIYVPASLVEAYKVASNWSYFASLIVAIENIGGDA